MKATNLQSLVPELARYTLHFDAIASLTARPRLWLQILKGSSGNFLVM
jgi:hypothetical protein